MFGRVWIELSAFNAERTCQRAFRSSIVLASQTVHVTIDAIDKTNHDDLHHHVGIHEHAPW